ncbi:putative secreted protein [Pseudoalteromonas luteoviolacea B = ATCC 29581]|nr:putative secreted protein [Pseudoalteromonas luteoviolacea B = ATCC 29581]
MPYITLLLLLGLSVLGSGCTIASVPLGQPERLYDFDHQVHYSQTRFSDESFILSIDSDSYAHFQQQSTFLLRHAATLCGDKEPVLTIKNGIQDFERFTQPIRPLKPKLLVWVRCSAPSQFPTQS